MGDEGVHHDSLYPRSKTFSNLALGNAAGADGSENAPYASAPLRAEEGLTGVPRQVMAPNILDVRKGRGISSPGLLEGLPHHHGTGGSHRTQTAYTNERGSVKYDADDQGSTSDSPIRPFSFAVWAGNGGSATPQSPGGGSSRESRNSGVLGKWSGSVTSFFGGSQGGASGSMMDMQ